MTMTLLPERVDYENRLKIEYCAKLNREVFGSHVADEITIIDLSKMKDYENEFGKLTNVSFGRRYCLECGEGLIKRTDESARQEALRLAIRFANEDTEKFRLNEDVRGLLSGVYEWIFIQHAAGYPGTILELIYSCNDLVEDPEDPLLLYAMRGRSRVIPLGFLGSTLFAIRLPT